MSTRTFTLEFTVDELRAGFRDVGVFVSDSEWSYIEASLLATKQAALLAAKPDAKTCEPDFSAVRELRERLGCPYDPAPAASQPAWLPLGQHPGGKCRDGCGLPNACADWRIGADARRCWTKATGDCFCTAYCIERDRAKAVPRDSGQPGVPDGYVMAPGWVIRALCPEGPCLRNKGHRDDLKRPDGRTFANPHRHGFEYLWCWPCAESEGAIVPVEPSRPVTGEAVRPYRSCPSCGHAPHNQHDCIRCNCAITPPAPGNHPGTAFVCDRCEGGDRYGESNLCKRCTAAGSPNSRAPGKPDEAPLSEPAKVTSGHRESCPCFECWQAEERATEDELKRKVAALEAKLAEAERSRAEYQKMADEFQDKHVAALARLGEFAENNEKLAARIAGLEASRRDDIVREREEATDQERGRVDGIWEWWLTTPNADGQVRDRLIVEGAPAPTVDK